MVALGFAVPGSIDQPTGGYTYDRRVIAALRGLGCEVDIIDLGDGFPYPDAGTRSGALERLRAVPPGRPIVIDGLALGVLPEAAKALAATHPVVALVHHPLALESRDFAGDRRGIRGERARGARRRAPCHRHQPVDAARAGRRLRGRRRGGHGGLAGQRPDRRGGEAAPRHRRRCSRSARWCRARATTSSIDALAAVADLDWRLVIAGDRTRDRATADAIEAQIAARGLGARVRMRGAVGEDELDALHREADLFVLASRHEGYGMAFAAAISHGLPVVGTRAGAIPETVPPGAGILVRARRRGGARGGAARDDRRRARARKPRRGGARGRGAIAAIGTRRRGYSCAC